MLGPARRFDQSPAWAGPCEREIPSAIDLGGISKRAQAFGQIPEDGVVAPSTRIGMIRISLAQEW